MEGNTVLIIVGILTAIAIIGAIYLAVTRQYRDKPSLTPQYKIDRRQSFKTVIAVIISILLFIGLLIALGFIL